MVCPRHCFLWACCVLLLSLGFCKDCFWSVRMNQNIKLLKDFSRMFSRIRAASQTDEGKNDR